MWQVRNGTIKFGYMNECLKNLFSGYMNYNVIYLRISDSDV